MSVCREKSYSYDANKRQKHRGGRCKPGLARGRKVCGTCESRGMRRDGPVSTQAAHDQGPGGRMQTLALSLGFRVELGRPQDRAECQGQDLLLQERVPKPAGGPQPEAGHPLARSPGNPVDGLRCLATVFSKTGQAG